ncbi:MAG TPA: sigma factor [Solirubrobacteraceae bacterium]|nr:sigma factor [Solirubrobacteraceae bacterium]
MRSGAEGLGGERFDALYRECAGEVSAYVASLLGDRGAAEDVTALAFESAYRARGRHDPRRGSPRAWLFGIARNAALDELRRRRRRATATVDPGAPALVEPADDAVVRRATCATRSRRSGRVSARSCC